MSRFYITTIKNIAYFYVIDHKYGETIATFDFKEDAELFCKHKNIQALN